jgi:hypothetical protein
MAENALTEREGRGTIVLHAIDPGLYSIHPAPLRGKDTLKLEEGELVEVPVKADTPHTIKWTKSSASTEGKTVHSGLTVGEGKRKRVDLQIPRTDYRLASLAGVFILALAAVVFSAWAALVNDPPRSTVITNTLPVGTLMPFAGALDQVRRDSLEQQGWCPAEGQTIPRPPNDSAPYWKIHGTIGSLWGTNPSGTAFKLPDLRGQFVRGVDLRNECNDRTSQADKSEASCRVGSTQRDAVASHKHGITFKEPLDEAAFFNVRGAGHRGRIYIDDASPHDGWRTNMPELTDGCEGCGAETRPKNVAVNWLVYVGAASCPVSTTD